MSRNGTANGNIVDELNDIITARNGIRSTMIDAGIASSTDILKDMNTALANAKKAAATYNTSTSDQTISKGLLLTGNQTIKAVTTSNIDAANIKYNVVVKVGDANSAGRIKNVTGTFTTESTSPITAATVLNGKIGWVNGSKITGTMTNNGSGTTTRKLTGTTTSVDIAAGYWSSKNTISVDTLAAPTVTLSSSSQTIQCKDKMMTGNITIPAVNYYYTSTAAPTATSGYNDGDVWLVTD